MRIQDAGDAVTLWASARDTRDWATKPGAAWPCSTLAGHRFSASFDRNGLFYLTVDGDFEKAHRIDGHEFSACAADMLAEKLTPEHPCYFVAVGQFRAEASR